MRGWKPGPPARVNAANLALASRQARVRSAAAVERLEGRADGIGLAFHGLVVADIGAGEAVDAPGAELFNVLHLMTPESDVVLGVPGVGEGDGVDGGDGGRFAVAEREGLDSRVSVNPTR